MSKQGNELWGGRRSQRLHADRLIRSADFLLLIACLTPGGLAGAQTIDITGLPTPGSAGQIVGSVANVDYSTHEVAAYLYIEGVGWWTKPNFIMPTVPIDTNGSFSIDIGTSGLDELATMYAVSLVPTGTSPPIMQSSITLDLGESSIASAYQQRFGTNLSFAGRNWGVKEAPSPVGPGANRYSANADDVWVDGEGLHLTIQDRGGQWYSTEVVLTENLGYGTYAFQTSSRQDILDANATFGAFTWDAFGDDQRIPNWPNREMDFEDSRWGNPNDPTNSQTVVQPWSVPGNLNRYTLPDLSEDAALTRFLVWSPGRVEFYTLLGHHQPDSFPPEDVIDHTVYTEDLPQRVIPRPGRENFRFNLWLNHDAPAGTAPIEVIVNDFGYTPLGDFNFDGEYNCPDVDALVAEIAAGTESLQFDLTGDSRVDAADLSAWLAAAGAANLPSGNSYLIGDANLDGFVDGQDFILWNQNKFTSIAAWCHGDFNADGAIDGQDFILWNSNKFSSTNGVLSIPEPSPGMFTIFLFLLTGVTGRRR